jgi:hypothetical protein
MEQLRPFILMVVLTAGCSSPEREMETAALRDSATDCIRREAIAVAPEPVDLETAVAAVTARCRGELWAEEKAAVNRFPGHRAYASEKYQAVRDARIQQAADAVALARTSGSANNGQ